ncbi:MAG: hypothetical protein E6J34_12725 [Chloroflexi bacterium]|nr:MAG: hypothetical protein E6J34_12725 [Chloroflexota bacterium]
MQNRSQRSSRKDIDYCPDTFGDLFAVDATSQYGQFDPDCLSERLHFITNTAQRLGFMSLQDAALADAEQYEVDDYTRERLQEFSVAGCHERLIALLFDRDVLETNGQHRLDIPAQVEKIYLSEFEALRKLDIMNKSLQDWDLDYFTEFSFLGIHTEMLKQAPNLLRLIHALAGIKLQENEPSPDSELQDNQSLTSRKQQRVVVIVFSLLANLRNRHTNFVQGMFSLFLFASKVPRRVQTVVNHVNMCVSSNTLRNFLKRAANEARSRLRSLGKGDEAFLLVFDNLTKYNKVRDQRILHCNFFLNFTVGFVLIPPPSRQHKMHTQADFNSNAIRTLALADVIPSPQDECDMGEAFLSHLSQVFTSCLERSEAPNKARFSSIKFPLRELFQINRADLPEFLPLPTYDQNEGVINEVIKILDYIQSDVGLSDERAIKNLLMVHGDFMTVRNVRYISLGDSNSREKGSSISPGRSRTHKSS